MNATVQLQELLLSFSALRIIALRLNSWGSGESVELPALAGNVTQLAPGLRSFPSIRSILDDRPVPCQLTESYEGLCRSRNEHAFYRHWLSAAVACGPIT
jgi:hypothetical protein